METISKEELIQIEKIPGEIIGHATKNKLEFILKKEGKDGLEKIEKEMEKLGYPLKYKEIKEFHWYPVKQDILLIVVAKKLFGWDDEILREMGKFNAKISLMAKIMMRYFISIKRIAKEVGKYWRKYRTVGRLETETIKENYLILALKEFLGHPLLCRFLEGYFWQIALYVVPKNSNLKVEEIECPFEGGKIHRFKINW